MTSKISFKLLKENMRHRLVVIVIAVFYFLLSILNLVIQIQNEIYSGPVYYTKQNIFGGNAGVNLDSLVRPDFVQILFVCLLALLLAVDGFLYLHSKKKTDLYHSLPIKRRTMFQVITINSVMLFALLQAAAMIIELVIIAVLGYFTSTLFSYMIGSFICYVVIFTGAFLLTALAMIMTGNLVVGILGTLVFATWSPIVIKNLFFTLGSIFLDGFGGSPTILNLLDYGSPVYLSFRMAVAKTVKWQWDAMLFPFAALCLWIIILTFLCQFLFEKRPSEAAEKAMAFPMLNSVIRVLLVIPAAIYTGSYFYSMTMSSTKIWVVFGIIFGTFLFHGIIECIYQFDVRGLWSRQKQMTATMIVTLCIAAFFYFDVCGYDTYVPKAENVQNIAITTSYMGERESVFWGKTNKTLPEEEKEKLLAVLKKNVENLKEPDDTDAETIMVTYTMKNGTEKMRNYTFTQKQADAVTSELFQSEEYKKNIYSLYTADWENIENIRWDSGFDSQILNLTQEEQKQFLTTYLEELDGLTYEEMKTVVPVSELLINHEMMQSLKLSEDYYFIYPSFKKTLAFLKNKGCETDKSFANVNITTIDIEKYTEDGEEQSWTVTDKAVIETIKDKLYTDSFNYPIYYAGYRGTIDNYVITVRYADKDGETELSAITDIDTLKQME